MRMQKKVAQISNKWKSRNIQVIYEIETRIIENDIDSFENICYNCTNQKSLVGVISILQMKVFIFCK